MLQQSQNWSVAMTIRVQLDFPAAAEPAFRGLPHRAATGRWFAWLVAAVARWQERRLLETLDDRTLHDIGISRSQALAEARKPCWRP
jgi:uncharacterized protein YjiS (DUF1127 family)